jgi:hypothetical protein
LPAIHLHRLDGDDEAANVDGVTDAPGLHDAVSLHLHGASKASSLRRQSQWA